MATVLFNTFVPEVAPHLIGCPTYTMEQYIAKVATDLCNRAHVWRVQLADVTLVAGTSNYVLASPVANTEVHNVLRASLVPATTDYPKALETSFSDDEFRARYPEWPDTDHPGQPLFLFRSDDQSVNIAPVPDDETTYTLKMYASIRPTSTATGWEGTVQNEYRRALFHGVLYELMTMPERTWTNEKFGAYHGRQWNNMLAAARARANKGFGRASIHVQHRPWA